jgi:Flp pilus assembly protein, ATPase CpaF
LQEVKAKETCKATIRQYLVENKQSLKGLSTDESVLQLYANLIGYGPLTDFMEHATERRITEIKVHGTNGIYTKEYGIWKSHPEIKFKSEQQLNNIVRRILNGSDKPLSESQPMVDNAELPDGSRVTMIRTPLTKSGLIMIIRIFTAGLYSSEALVNMRAVTQIQDESLKRLVRAKMNLLYVGGTDTGKTTVMGAYAGHFPSDTHVVSIEDANELQLAKRHENLNNVTDLFTKKDEYTDYSHVDLFYWALRASPDCFIFNEIRKPPETAVLLDAMISGHPGSSSTLHADDARRAVTRLVNNLRENDTSLTVELAREKVCEAVDALVVIRRVDGVRFVSDIVEPLWNPMTKTVEYHKIVQRAHYKEEGKMNGFSAQLLEMAASRNGIPTEELEGWNSVQL